VLQGAEDDNNKLPGTEWSWRLETCRERESSWGTIKQDEEELYKL